MGQDGGYQTTIDKLYNLHKAQGFLREEEALNLMTADGVSLVGISRVTDKLIDMGVIFSDKPNEPKNADDNDRAQSDYKTIFREALDISPGLKFFVNYVRNVRSPQNREWQILIPQVRNGNAYAFSRLFDMYSRVIIKIALRFHKEGSIELDDAVQEGSMGLIHAIRQFNASINGNFGSYAPLWIQQYIQRAIADKGRAIRLPVHLTEDLKKLQQYENKSYGVLDEMLSIDALLEEKPDFDIIGTDNDVNEIVERHILKSEIAKIMMQFSQKERHILCLRYGLIDGKEHTLKEISEIYGVTRERIRQIEKKMLQKFRFRSRHLKGFWQ